jgi:hypothetical protein
MCYLSFFIIKDPFKNDDEHQKYFLRDPGLLIVKSQLPLQFLEVFGSSM